MKKHLSALIIGAIALVFLAACSSATKKQAVIGKPDFKTDTDIMSPEALWAMGRLGEVAVSPDGKKIVYAIKYFSIAENKGNTDLYISSAEELETPVRITETPENEYNISWSKDGQKIRFLKKGNIHQMDPNGKNVEVLSDLGDVEGYLFSPDESKIALIRQIKSYQSVADRYPDLDKSSGQVYNELMYRHWDEFVSTIPHIFLADFSNKKLSNPLDILEGEPYEAPMKPFGGIEQMAWAPDGKTLAYTSRKLTGKAYALSTNSDIYLYSIESKNTQNISQGMMGYDMNPSFSPDGRYLAWQSMEREGYEADKLRIMLCDFEQKSIHDFSEGFDQNAENLSWSEDAQTLYFTSNYQAKNQIYALSIAKKSIQAITQGVHDYHAVYPLKDRLIGLKMSMSKPSEVYSIKLSDGSETALTDINGDIFKQLSMGKVEERIIKTTDNKDMLVWLIYPPHFDPNKKYPAILYCQGGPQSGLSQFWSYRWNFQMMAANDYIIVAPNRRGLPGFGQAWNEQISGDYGGQNMKDYFSAIDAISKEAFVDENRLGCVGASYGGFSVYWLAGHHNKRFKAFIAHDGMFNLEQQYLETEEMWFVNWDLGGPYWDKSNPVAKEAYSNSPHRFVEKWDSPILIIHGEKDYRIVASQGMAAFNAARLLDVPAEYLYFPDENHWVLQPQNGILWQRRFFRWLDTWVKQLPEEELNKAYYAEKEGSNKNENTTKKHKEVNTETQVSQ